MSAGLAIVLVFGGLIFVHELGHFLAAKRAGIQVDEFALGFGPRLAGFRRGETEYNLRIIPLGGFVRMAGMFPHHEEDGREPEQGAVAPGRGFNDKTVGQRMGVVLAGPVMNIVAAAVLFTSLFNLVGKPMATLTIQAVEKDRPAARAGLQPGDRILAVGGEAMDNWGEFSRIIAASPERPLQLDVRRDNRDIPVSVTPVAIQGKGFLGIQPAMEVQRLPLVSAVPDGFETTFRFLGFIAANLGTVAGGEGLNDLMGPVGIASEIGKASQSGPGDLLTLAAFISISLGLFNLFPIPALDGSRFVFLAIEGLRGRPVDPRKENWIHAVGFALLMFLIVFVTYRDILRLVVG